IVRPTIGPYSEAAPSGKVVETVAPRPDGDVLPSILPPTGRIYAPTPRGHDQEVLCRKGGRVSRACSRHNRAQHVSVSIAPSVPEVSDIGSTSLRRSGGESMGCTLV